MGTGVSWQPHDLVLMSSTLPYCCCQNQTSRISNEKNGRFTLIYWTILRSKTIIDPSVVIQCPTILCIMVDSTYHNHAIWQWCTYRPATKSFTWSRYKHIFHSIKDSHHRHSVGSSVDSPHKCLVMRNASRCHVIISYQLIQDVSLNKL